MRSVTIEAMTETRPIRNPEKAQSRELSPQRGFSLLELVMVVAIAMILLATALPQLATSLTYTKWRGEMSDLSGVFQTCRSQAIKNNAAQQLDFTTNDGKTVAYIDVPGSTDPSLSGKTQVWMFSQFSKVDPPTGENPSPLNKATMWGGSDTSLPDTTHNICFNARGIPCICPETPAGYCTSITNGYAFYFNQDQQWAAVGVSPAGRIKTFFWDGGAWAN